MSMVTRHAHPGAVYPVLASLTQRQAEAVVRGLTLTSKSNATARQFLAELSAAVQRPPVAEAPVPPSLNADVVVEMALLHNAQ